MKTHSITTLAMALFIVSAIAQEPAVRAIRPNDLLWRSVPGYPAGYERAVLEGGTMESHSPRTYRVRLPPHCRIQPHTHPADEHVTVLKGTWHFGQGKSFDEKRMQAFETGSFVIIPAGLPHYIMAGSEETVVQVQGIGPAGMTYVSEVRP